MWSQPIIYIIIFIIHSPWLLSDSHIGFIPEGESSDGVGQLSGHTVIPPLVSFHLWRLSSNLHVIKWMILHEKVTLVVSLPDLSIEMQIVYFCPPDSLYQSHHHLLQMGWSMSQPLWAIQHRRWTAVRQKWETSNPHQHVEAGCIGDPSNWQWRRHKLWELQSEN